MCFSEETLVEIDSKLVTWVTRQHCSSHQI